MALTSDEKNILCGKRVVIIGRPQNISRRDAVARLELLGGTNQLKVNTLTDFVVLPSGGSGESQLLTDAKAFEQAGQLQIITEAEFLNMISGD